MLSLIKLLLRRAVKSSKNDVDDLFYELFIAILNKDSVGVVAMLKLLLQKWEDKLNKENERLWQELKQK